MYKKIKMSNTTINRNVSVEGETIEQRLERITNNQEPIKDGAPLIYTDRKDGVQAGYNIKTDRFEIAVDAMDKVTKSNLAKRQGIPKMEIVKDGETEPTRATNNGTE
jgi:hypothetical protein